MRRLATTIAFLGAATLMVAGCDDPVPPSLVANGQSQSGAVSMSAPEPFDTSSIETVPEIAAMVPASVKERGILRNGASTEYAPGEFRASDGQTPVGYDIDIVNALAKVMGLEKGQTSHAEFPTILPALGTKFDVGASSFTITNERLAQVHMISYVQVGSSFAVAKGNPGKFNPNDLCGSTIGVQTGTYQQDYAAAESEKCVKAGKAKIEIMPHDLQTDIATKVIGRQYDATFADSTVVGFAVEKSQGQMEQVGEVIESAPQGITVSKEDEQLAKAVQAAMQHLMDKGILTDILDNYGAEQAGLSRAELDPTQ
ncbi:MAG: ABC transporter substrate-binding protein [Actinomycetaceae bacterium]|nr:ABC transporter substrate-binding protein [Actinomycetaceae bacterium]